jgi:hypothetical protein
MSAPYNESAFPMPGPATDEDLDRRYPGMTLRDYFAAKAMQALLAQGWDDEFRAGQFEVAHEMGMTLGQLNAKIAYDMADEMLLRRGQ